MSLFITIYPFDAIPVDSEVLVSFDLRIERGNVHICDVVNMDGCSRRPSWILNAEDRSQRKRIRSADLADCFLGCGKLILANHKGLAKR
jgi:hypothetical protein